MQNDNREFRLEFRCSLVHSSFKVLLYCQVLVHALFQQSTGFIIVASGESTGKLLEACQQFRQTNLAVGPKHGTTSPYGPTIAIEVDDVDIGRLLRNALLQDFESLIHQWEQDAFDNLIQSQGTPRSV